MNKTDRIALYGTFGILLLFLVLICGALLTFRTTENYTTYSNIELIRDNTENDQFDPISELLGKEAGSVIKEFEVSPYKYGLLQVGSKLYVIEIHLGTIVKIVQTIKIEDTN